MLFTASWGNTTVLIWSGWEGVRLQFFLCLLLKSENARPALTHQPQERSPQNWIPLHKPVITHAREVLIVYSRAVQAWWYSRDGARPARLSAMLFTGISLESVTSQVQPCSHDQFRNFHTLHIPDNFYACSRGGSLLRRPFLLNRCDFKYYNAHNSAIGYTDLECIAKLSVYTTDIPSNPRHLYLNIVYTCLLCLITELVNPSSKKNVQTLKKKINIAALKGNSNFAVMGLDTATATKHSLGWSAALWYYSSFEHSAGIKMHHQAYGIFGTLPCHEFCSPDTDCFCWVR